jgi:hypothetical protein
MIKTSIAVMMTAGSLALGALALPTTSVAQVEFSITFAPPPLPVYEQPPIPAPGYLWAPGYWSYGPFGYYWVPGTWVEPPAAGLLWTPGYWGWSDGFFVWNAGYWAPQIGFYGGVNYGFGYPGHGYEGGYWRDNQFYYNRVVNNVTNVEINNVYSKTVVNNTTVNRISYVGGPGGLTAKPTSEEERVTHEHHTPATAVQVQHRETAAARPEMVASVNHGKPPIAATSKPNSFDAHFIGARAGGPVTVHASELPKPQAAPPPSRSASNVQEYQRQQSALQAQQQQERQALAQMQERDHAYVTQQHGSPNATAAMEHQHLQQTQFLQQRQASEMQSVHQPAPHPPQPSRSSPERH